VRSPASETSATRLRDRLRESGSAVRDVLGAPQLRRAELAYALECTGFTVDRPTHSALLPTLYTTTRELTSANVVRGIVGADRPSSDAANAVVARHLAEPAERSPAPIGI